MRGIPAGPAQYHGDDDLLDHSLAALGRMSAASQDPAARLAAFFHDLGKLATPTELLPRHPGHDRAGVPLARAMAQRIRLPEKSARAIVAAVKLHLLGIRWRELRRSTRINLAQQAVKSGIAPFFPRLVAADCGSDDLLPGWNLFPLLVGFSPTELGMDAPALAGMSPADRQSLLMQYRHRRLKELETTAEHEAKEKR
jgi:tRNA nucleotidyltransferase (CCA-adding enzyme)